MVQVPLPTVRDQTPKGTLDASSARAAPIPDMGAQAKHLGAAVGASAGALLDVQLQINEDHAAATSKSGLNEWTEYADDETRGFRNRIGEDAVKIDGKDVDPGAAPEQVADRVQARIDSIEQGMSSELARKLFRERAEQRMGVVRSRLHTHHAQQLRVMNHGQNTAGMKRHSDSYIVDRDPQDFADALAYAREIADDGGIGGEQRDAFLLEVKTRMISGHVDQLLAEEDFDSADEFLKGIPRGDMDKLVRSRQRRKIDGVLKAEKSKRGAFKIFDLNGHESEQSMRESAAARLPAQKRNELMRSAVVDVAKDRGLVIESRGPDTGQERRGLLKKHRVERPKFIKFLEKSGVPRIERNRRLKEFDESFETMIGRVPETPRDPRMTVEEFMKVPGDWSHLLTDPDVMAKVQEKISSLDDDILFARYPGQPPANDPESGSYKRMLDRVKKLYDDGDIDAEERQQYERHLDELVNRRTRVESKASAESLEQVEEIFQRTRIPGAGGELTSVYSSEFRTKYPSLFEELRDRGLLASADKLASSVLTRRNDQGWYDQLHRDAGPGGALSKMTYDQLYEKYYPNLSGTGWAEAVRKWAPYHEGGEARIVNDPATKWETALDRWLGARKLITGTDNNGIPKPDGLVEQTRRLNLMDDLGRAVKDSGRDWEADDVIEWAEKRETATILTRAERGWYNPAWGLGIWGDSHITESVKATDYQAKIRDAEARGAEEEAKALKEGIRVNYNGREVGTYADGVRVKVVDNEDVPIRATDYIRDSWRLLWYGQRVGTESAVYKKLREDLSGTGALSPHAERNERAIDKVFDDARVPAWPGPAMQSEFWMRFKKLYPKVRPRNESADQLEPDPFGRW